MSLTPQEQALIKQLIQDINWIKKRLTVQETVEQAPGTVPINTGDISNDAITNAKLRNSGALSVIGRSANSTGDPADISATAASDSVLRESSSVLGFGTIATGGIANDAISNAKLANMAANTMKSNITGGSADPADNDIATVLAQYIHAATSKATPVDNDELPLIDSAASNVLKKLTWANLKATLKTYLDTLYGLLAGANTWTNNNAFNSTATSGTAVSVTRNLTATSTDSPVVSILQDHTGDDQPALKVEQDGTGDILQLLDGANSVFTVADGGNVHIGLADVTSGQALSISGAAQQIIRNAASTFGAAIQLVKNRNATVGSHTVVNSGDELGKIQFFGSDGDSYENGATITAYVDGTPGSSDMPGRIEFQVSPDGSATVATALTIFNDKKIVTGGLSSVGASQIGVKAGSSTNDAAVGGDLYINSTAVGNVGTGDDDLMTYTVPANSLSTNNMRLTFEGWGTFGANGNSKTVKVKFGSDSFTVINGSINNNGKWYIRGHIIRTGATTQDVFISASDSSINGGAPAFTISTAARTLSSANDLKLTGTGTADNDISQEGFIVSWGDNNT